MDVSVVRLWRHFSDLRRRGNDVRLRRQNGPCLRLARTSENDLAVWKSWRPVSFVARLPLPSLRRGDRPWRCPFPREGRR